MKILPKIVVFEWDKGNIDKNYLEHHVTNKEAEQIFKNSQNFIFASKKHSVIEKRYMIWGITNEKRKLTIFFTVRNNKIRVISARNMHKKERREYEKKIKTNTKV